MQLVCELIRAQIQVGYAAVCGNNGGKKGELYYHISNYSSLMDNLT